MFLQLVTTAQNTLVKILIDKCRRKQKIYWTVILWNWNGHDKIAIEFWQCLLGESKKELSEILIVLREHMRVMADWFAKNMKAQHHNLI